VFLKEVGVILMAVFERNIAKRSATEMMTAAVALYKLPTSMYVHHNLHLHPPSPICVTVSRTVSVGMWGHMQRCDCMM
jgi:H+/gluconate symporter-like permease